MRMVHDSDSSFVSQTATVSAFCHIAVEHKPRSGTTCLHTYSTLATPDRSDAAYAHRAEILGNDTKS